MFRNALLGMLLTVPCALAEEILVEPSALAVPDDAVSEILGDTSEVKEAGLSIEDLLASERPVIEKKPFTAYFALRNKRTNHGESFQLTDESPSYTSKRYTVTATQCLKNYEGLNENDVAFVRVFERFDGLDTEVGANAPVEPVFQGWMYRLHPSAVSFTSAVYHLSFNGCR